MSERGIPSEQIEAATVAIIHKCREIGVVPGKVGSAVQWGILAKAALVAARATEPAPQKYDHFALWQATTDWLYAIDRWGADSNEAYETQALCRETLRASAREVDG